VLSEMPSRLRAELQCGDPVSAGVPPAEIGEKKSLSWLCDYNGDEDAIKLNRRE
jgi:hypothetical protein